MRKSKTKSVSGRNEIRGTQNEMRGAGNEFRVSARTTRWAAAEKKPGCDAEFVSDQEFVRIDTNVSGSVSRDELRDALSGGGVNPEVTSLVRKIPNLAPLLDADDEHFDAVFGAMDTNGDAELDFSEFSTFCRAAAERTVWSKLGMPEGKPDDDSSSSASSAET